MYVIGTQEEPNTFIVLIGHVIKMILNDLLLYTQIRTSLHHHQRSFSFQQMKINTTKTQLVNMQKIKDCEVLSPCSALRKNRSPIGSCVLICVPQLMTCLKRICISRKALSFQKTSTIFHLSVPFICRLKCKLFNIMPVCLSCHDGLEFLTSETLSVKLPVFFHKMH